MEDAGYRPPKVERRDHTGEYEALRPSLLYPNRGNRSGGCSQWPI